MGGITAFLTGTSWDVFLILILCEIIVCKGTYHVITGISPEERAPSIIPHEPGGFVSRFCRTVSDCPCMHILLFPSAQLLTRDVTSILTVGHPFIETGRSLSDTLHLIPSSVASCALWVRLLEFC